MILMEANISLSSTLTLATVSSLVGCHSNCCSRYPPLLGVHSEPELLCFYLPIPHLDQWRVPGLPYPINPTRRSSLFSLFFLLHRSDVALLHLTQGVLVNSRPDESHLEPCHSSKPGVTHREASPSCLSLRM